MTTRERVTVSVVSGRRFELVRQFLRSLYETAPAAVDVSVVVTLNVPDPVSADALTSDAEQAGWAARLVVRTNEHPLGFAANHNLAILAHPADLYLIANDDIVVLPGAIERLLAYLRAPDNGRVGVASPLLLNEDRSVQGSTYSFPSPLRVLVAAADLRANRAFGALIGRAARSAAPGRSRSWAHDRTMAVDSVRGAFMLVRHEAIADAGLMDEIAIVGGEELEWHRRMHDHRWTVGFVHDAAVVHLGGQTVTADPALRTEYIKGWLNFFDRHGRRFELARIRLGLVLIFLCRYGAGVIRRSAEARSASREGLRVAVRWRTIRGATPLPVRPAPAATSDERRPT